LCGFLYCVSIERMASEIKKIGGSEIEIFVEVPAEKFDKYCEEIFEEISKDISVPGFRPGKVPRQIAEKNIKNEEILKKAAEKAIRETYFPILVENKIEAIGRPEIIITKIAKPRNAYECTLRGKGDSFCYKVKTAVLPEITLPDYKKIARDVRNKKEKEGEDVGKETEKARQKKRMEMLKAISGASQMEIPEILVKSEKEKMLGELKSGIENMGLNWKDYLSNLKKTEEDLEKEWQADAVTRIKYGLVLRELAERENIQVSAEELESEAEEFLKNLSADSQLYPSLDRDYLRSYIYGIIRNEKVFNFLETC